MGISRRNLIDQALTKISYIGIMSAATTAQETGEGIDTKGAASAQLFISTIANSGNNTAFHVYVYDSDTVSGTYTVYESSTYTLSVTSTAVVTSDTIDMDLLGAKRWLKAYISVTAATTTTSNVTAGFVLGDYDSNPPA
jgi:hypothetical protein